MSKKIKKETALSNQRQRRFPHTQLPIKAKLHKYHIMCGYSFQGKREKIYERNRILWNHLMNASDIY